ncbi:MAG: DUF2058 domain-containing protein [endosymbiont of Galathealinum brachiosum]|uniref:DUF2058 domain-containing protein n=1 Tax=endosymbiont of Galathealinum brachiosum TaxID=2200906 RepID=A0A370DAH1_9GAMM|nr:MAG: DUF2058 domain-containing protein [endosymbiont of Galathealinum brachiosum]
MSNPFAEQFLKAGVVSKQQVQKAKQEKNKKKKQQHNNKKIKVDNTAELKRIKAEEEKAARDRELNKKKQDQAKGKALSAEINQLILANKLNRDEGCDLSYNFEHQNKVKKIYINAEMKQQLVKGKLGIARIEGIYELIPLDIAEKIQQRNAKRVVILEEEVKDENDPYADYEVPDDLVW